MAINSQTLSSVQNKVTGLTTNETDFRSGLDDALTQINNTEVKLSEVTTNDLIKLNDITATANEINVLDGITASVTELNVLNGITATTSELNKLDGLTATTAELNILDGITSSTAEINKLDGFTGSASDLNKIAAVTSSSADLNALSGFVSTHGGQLADLLRTIKLDAAGNGSNGQVLTSNGSGDYSWTTPSSFSWTLYDEDGSEVSIDTDHVQMTSTDGIDIDFGTGSGVDGDPIQLNFTNTDKGSSQKIFTNVASAGQTAITANTNTDTLNFAGGNHIAFGTDNVSKTLTLSLKNDSVSSSILESNSVITSKIQDSAVTTPKINNGAVTSDKLASNSVTLGKVANSAIGYNSLTTDAINAIRQMMYPVGSIYTNAYNGTNPSTLLGFGTWSRYAEGRVLLSQQDGNGYADQLGETGGSNDAVVVSHQHTGNTAGAGDHAHNIHIYEEGGGPSTALIDARSGGIIAEYDTATGVAGHHGHSFTTDATGESGAGKNLPPYIVVYMWVRTA